MTKAGLRDIHRDYIACLNVFYEFRSEKIWHVWSVIDKAAIESQL